MADTVIENLITTLSFDFDEDTLEKFDGLVGDAVKGLAAVVAGATAAATAIFAFTQSIAASNDELGKFAERIGVDLSAMQELGFVAELNGGSIQSMNDSLANVSRIASEAARGIGAGVEVFGLLGISATDASGRIKSADSLILEISDSMARLRTQAERLEFAQKLGIGPDLLLAIQQGSDAIRRQRQEARELGFIIDKDATQAAANFNDEMLRLTKVVTGISNAIGTRLSKQITPLIKQFVEWFKINKQIIQQNLTLFLDRLVTTIRAIFNVAGRVIRVVLSLVSAMGGWKNSIIAVTALWALLNANVLLLPVAIIAAGAAILLILEDIITFAEGGDSAIGQLADRFPVFDAVLRGTLQLLSMVVEGWQLIFTQGKDALEGLGMLVEDTGNRIREAILAPLRKVGDLFLKFHNLTLGRFAEENIQDTTSGIIASAQRLQGTRETTGGFPATLQGSRTEISTVTNRPTVTVNINGGNLEEVRRVVGDVLSEQYSGAQTNLQSQVEF